MGWHPSSWIVIIPSEPIFWVCSLLWIASFWKGLHCLLVCLMLLLLSSMGALFSQKSTKSGLAQNLNIWNFVGTGCWRQNCSMSILPAQRILTIKKELLENCIVIIHPFHKRIRRNMLVEVEKCFSEMLSVKCKCLARFQNKFKMLQCLTILSLFTK